jgi:exonuclease III
MCGSGIGRIYRQEAEEVKGSNLRVAASAGSKLHSIPPPCVDFKKARRRDGQRRICCTVHLMAKDDTLGVVSWNMAGAFPLKDATVDLWEVLDSLQPDIALLQECRPPTAGSARGHFHFAPTRHGWGTAVWSRFALTQTTSLPHAVECDWESYRAALDGYVASAAVYPPGGSMLSVTSFHAYPSPISVNDLTAFNIDDLLPPGPRREVWPVDLAWWALRNLTATGPCILGDDWNMARLFDTNYGVGSKMGGNQARFDRMANSGWHDVARKFHKDEVQTYFKPRSGAYQLDHIFVSESIMAATTRFEVVTSPAVRKASDHAALVMEFRMPMMDADFSGRS